MDDNVPCGWTSSYVKHVGVSGSRTFANMFKAVGSLKRWWRST